MSNVNYNSWPALPYAEFKPLSHLLHMSMQVIGKLKLSSPFEPHWANVALWLTSRGLTTGTIPFGEGVFSVDVDFINHYITCSTSWGQTGKFHLKAGSVANFTQTLFRTLQDIGVDIQINMKPQEVANNIPFNEDTDFQPYTPELINAWWRILISSKRVLQRYRAKYLGPTPSIGLMWGTLDLRDARYLEQFLPATGMNSDFIRRNAMDAPQVEAGWWAGNEGYEKPAYFSFLYPQPPNIENVTIAPHTARWDAKLGEFVLDYDDIRLSKNPEEDLLNFFESAYEAQAIRAGWDPKLIAKGYPI